MAVKLSFAACVCTSVGCVENVYLCSCCRNVLRRVWERISTSGGMCRASCIFNLSLCCLESEHPAFTLRRRPPAFRWEKSYSIRLGYHGHSQIKRNKSYMKPHKGHQLVKWHVGKCATCSVRPGCICRAVKIMTSVGSL